VEEKQVVDIAVTELGIGGDGESAGAFFSAPPLAGSPPG